MSYYNSNDLKKREKIEAVEQFIYQELQLDIRVADVYNIGPPTSETSAAHIVTLFSGFDKGKILRNAKKLKGLVNEENRKFYISEHLPAPLNEVKRREKDIISSNNAQDERNKLDMEYRNGKLNIVNEPYKKKVLPPTAADILSMTDEEMTTALNYKLYKGKPVVVEGNTFTAFTRSVSTHSEIRNAYYRMKLMYPGIRHSVCAYSIPGRDTHYGKDYSDDGDIGCGRALLTAMKDSKINNRVIFVTRHTGGKKIGAQRFTAMVNAAKNVLQAHPYNEILNMNQSFVDKAQVEEKREDPRERARTYVKADKPARGYGPGRGRGGVVQKSKTTHQVSMSYQQAVTGELSPLREKFNFAAPMSVRLNNQDYAMEDWKEQ